MDDRVQRIYQAFSPTPLSAEQTDLYVRLDQARGGANVAERLGKRIRLAAPPTCQVLAGHRGSGKSTELAQLCHDLGDPRSGEPRLFAVLCAADEDIDRNDVDFPEILIAIIKQTAKQLKDRLGISLKPGYFKDLIERFKKVLTSDISLDEFELGKGLLKLSGAIRSSPDARMAVRKLLEPDAGNWIYAANDLLGQATLELSKKGYAGLVVIVDDLDKMVLRPHDAGCSTQEYLFVHRAAQLSSFACHMIYTMPLELAYSHQEQTIAKLYGGRVPVVPMTQVATRPPKSRPYKTGMKLFQQIIAKRLASAAAVEQDLFDTPKVRDELIRLSGGQPTELMSLVRESIVSGSLPINEQLLKRARQEGRRAYARQLRIDHWPILKKAKASGQLTRTKDNDQAVRELLESRAILLYVNDQEWYGVNPLAADIKPPPTTRRKR